MATLKTRNSLRTGQKFEILVGQRLKSVVENLNQGWDFTRKLSFTSGIKWSHKRDFVEIRNNFRPYVEEQGDW